MNDKKLLFSLFLIVFLLMQSFTMFAQITSPVDDVSAGIETASTGLTIEVYINDGNRFYGEVMPSIRVYATGSYIDVDVYLQKSSNGVSWEYDSFYYSESWGDGSWDFEIVSVSSEDYSTIEGKYLRWVINTYSGSGLITYSAYHNIMFFAQMDYKGSHDDSAATLHTKVRDYYDDSLIKINNSTTTQNTSWVSEHFELPKLAMYDVVIFSNTEGNPIPSSIGRRDDFEKYMEELCGGYVGHHAALDCFYKTDQWDWYFDELTGDCHYHDSTKHPGGYTEGDVDIYETWHDVNKYLSNSQYDHDDEWYIYYPDESPDPSKFSVIHELGGVEGDREDDAYPDPDKQAIAWYREFYVSEIYDLGKAVCMGYGHKPSSWTNTELSWNTMRGAIEWAGGINIR